MDRRSWPWKKKSSDKSSTVTTTDANNASSPNAADAKQEQETIKYVQITVEAYAHMKELEDQVKTLNEEVSNLNDKLSSALSESTTKDNLVKQHAKVAEEAVSGWEKAEAEALALKTQLESVTLLKLTVEDRAAHLDGALKECMKQVRMVKEESEQKLHDVVFAKTKQWEKIKAELEAKIDDSEQELLRSSAEISALSRSLQERSNYLMKINDEKSEAEAEIEVLKNDIQSCEREINSLKYELHVVAKELEIRNEEKNMSARSAEVANKHHLEDVKKISKLEAECQRLRGLVRKKLPGPAALAQMKIEVESLGRDYGESRTRRSPARSSTPNHMSPSEFAHENMQQCRKENEFLTTRMLAMEEEMKMLKEALSKRNSELQSSRNLCAKTANRLRSIETHFHAMNQQIPQNKLLSDIAFEVENNPSSLTSLSEDGNDEEVSNSDSWANALMSELSQFKKEKSIDKSNKSESSNHLELMDDFLEMEKLASTTDNNTKQDENEVSQTHELALSNDDLPLAKLQSKINHLFESHSKESDMEKLLKDIQCIVHDIHEELPPRTETHSNIEPSMQKESDIGTEVKENSNSIILESSYNAMNEKLKDAVMQIHEFVLAVGKEASCEIAERIEEFSASVNKTMCNEESLDNFLLALSHILSEKGLLSFRRQNDKCNEEESCSPDCIDKVTLLENKLEIKELAKETLDSPSSDNDIEVPTRLSFDIKSASHSFSLEEFEQLKLQKDSMETELNKCKETIEATNDQVVKMEQQLSELQLQLTASEKSNSLAETQLKCMAESYKSLELQKQQLEDELNSLHAKVELLEAELQEEKKCHDDDLAKYKEFQDEMESNTKCLACLNPLEAADDVEMNKEKELASAAEKLAECQETIFLLGKQLNALRPPSESLTAFPMSKTLEDELFTNSIKNTEFTASPLHTDADKNAAVVQNTGGESPLNGYVSEASPYPKSPLNPKLQSHRSSNSSSSSSAEKHGRGISRFFSKGKSEH